MTLERAIEILEAYNKWRRGEIENYPAKAREIGEAIDTILKHLKK
jgi:hypothetical protein